MDSVSLMSHSSSDPPPPPSWQSSRGVKCDVRPSRCSSITISSITQQVLKRHESAIRSTDNCIFLRSDKVARPVGINLAGDSDWCNERTDSRWARRLSYTVACLPLEWGRRSERFFKGWKFSKLGQRCREKGLFFLLFFKCSRHEHGRWKIVKVLLERPLFTDWQSLLVLAEPRIHRNRIQVWHLNLHPM